MQSLILKGKNMATYSSLKSQIAKLEKQAADLYKKEVAGVAAKVRALVQEYGLTAADLGFTGKPAKGARKTRQVKTEVKTAGVPKYRDPSSGKTWTGKGKAPGWIHEALENGKSKDDFLIGKKAASGKPAVTKATKAAKSVMTAKIGKVVKFKSGAELADIL
jgi:DNA-binding protein H-NS